MDRKFIEWNIREFIKGKQKEYTGIERAVLRMSLLQDYVMRWMSDAENMQEAREIFEVYTDIILETV